MKKFVYLVLAAFLAVGASHFARADVFVKFVDADNLIFNLKNPNKTGLVTLNLAAPIVVQLYANGLSPEKVKKLSPKEREAFELLFEQSFKKLTFIVGTMIDCSNAGEGDSKRLVCRGAAADRFLDAMIDAFKYDDKVPTPFKVTTLFKTNASLGNTYHFETDDDEGSVMSQYFSELGVRYITCTEATAPPMANHCSIYYR